MLKKTNISFDTDQLLPLLKKIEWDTKNRYQINSPTGDWLYDCYEIKEQWKNTAFEDLLNSLARQYSIGEARLMKLTPGTCYPSHSDIDDRLHLNIVSNDQSYLVDLDKGKLYPTMSDNTVYYMDASRRHVAANFGATDRIQLVIRVRLPKIDHESFKSYRITFKNIPETFRYDFDNKISPYISKSIKQLRVGFFKVLDTGVEILCDMVTIKLLKRKLKMANLDFTIE